MKPAPSRKATPARKPAPSRKAGASKKGRVRRGLLGKALRFVGEHPKAATTALAAGVGAYALVYRSRKAISKAANHVADTVSDTAARVGRHGSKRPARPASSRRGG